MSSPIITHKSLTILYGTRQNAFSKESLQNYTALEMLTHAPFSYFSKKLELAALVILNQVHGTDGLSITTTAQTASINPGTITGDFMVTNTPGIGLAIATADCLALTLYDSKKNALGVAHAGWRGSVNGIAQALLDALYTNYQSAPEDIQAYLSPAARSCCYKVDSTVLDALEEKHSFIHSYSEKSVIKKDASYFFDLPLFNKIVLQKAGVPEAAIDISKSVCTIHTPDYCSYRRDGTRALRQLTCATLRA